ncbi:MAG: helix-turn-helix transcriptional regulator [Oscillospiraceae bacterium]
MDAINHVAAIRRAKGKKQQELAMAAGLAQATLSDIENGKICPSIYLALRIAEALNCDVNELFELERGKG